MPKHSDFFIQKYDFLFPILNLITNIFFLKARNKNFLISFSGGQDSIFLLFSLLYIKKQQKFSFILAYKNHIFQPGNLYFEFHVFKLSYILKTPCLLSLYCFEKYSELDFKYYRYDMLFRQHLYYQVSSLFKMNEIVISHSQTDLIESKFVEFLQKNILSVFIQNKKKPILNPLLKEWPQFLEKKNQNSQIQFQNRIKNNPSKKNKNFYIFYKFLTWKTNSFSSVKKNNYNILIQRPICFFPRQNILKIVQLYYLPVQNDETNFCSSYIHNTCRHQLIPIFRLLFGMYFEQHLFQLLNFQFNLLLQEKDGNLNLQKTIQILQNNNYLIFNIRLLKYQSLKELVTILFFINFFTKSQFSIKDFLFILKNDFNEQIFLLKLSFPQIILINNFFIIRFS